MLAFAHSGENKEYIHGKVGP